MRRSTPNCSEVVRAQQRLVGGLERALSEEGARIAAVLEAFVTDERKARLAAVLAARLDSVTVVFDAPHDPHNGAAVIRSCDAFGVRRLHVVERVEPFLAANSVARGSERWVDVVAHPTAAHALQAMKEGGYELVATHPEGVLSPADLQARPRIAIVLGNEREGIAEELRDACTTSVRVPMRGFAESLNVSVTAAILLSHATAGRPGDLGEPDRTLAYARALVLSVPHAPEILAAHGVLVRA